MLLEKLISDNELNDVIDQILVTLAENLLEVAVVQLVILRLFEADKDPGMKIQIYKVRK